MTVTKTWAARCQSFGDWGPPCWDAWATGGVVRERHLHVCRECREFYAREAEAEVQRARHATPRPDPDEVTIDLSRYAAPAPGSPGRGQPMTGWRRGARRSIKRHGSNDEYRAQDLPFVTYPSRTGVVYRAGTEGGGRRCPRCTSFIAVSSRVVRLEHPERGRWWVHERCCAECVQGAAS